MKVKSSQKGKFYSSLQHNETFYYALDFIALLNRLNSTSSPQSSEPSHSPKADRKEHSSRRNSNENIRHRETHTAEDSSKSKTNTPEYTHEQLTSVKR